MGTEKKGMPRNPTLERNEHRRNLDLGSHQRTPVDSRSDCVGDVDPMDTRAGRFQRTGWAVSDRPYTGESLLTSLVTKICRALVRRGAHRFR